jgi:hypothetical protein
MQYSPTPF